jgi:hypothetical protein
MPNQRSRSNERGSKKKNTHKPPSVMIGGEVKSIMHDVSKQATVKVAIKSNVDLGFQSIILFQQVVSQPQRNVDTGRLQFMGKKIFVNAANIECYFSMLLLLVVLYVSFTLAIKDLLLRSAGQSLNLLLTSISKHFTEFLMRNSRIDHIKGKTSPYGLLFLNAMTLCFQLNISDSLVTFIQIKLSIVLVRNPRTCRGRKWVGQPVLPTLRSTYTDEEM